MLFIDNTSVIKLSENPIMHSQSKHIMIWYHAICDFIEWQEIKLIHIAGDKMLADSLTKAVRPNILERFINELGLKRQWFCSAEEFI
jgi:hypothetical protein